ncbi:MAG TPA: helix-turn-helix domain-containing protein [Mycobacterium sp.]|nr:helix-turn-helix domain-containing protein [Mycobacterium sp.]
MSEADAIRTVALLGDDVRRRLYDFVRNAGRPVSRDEAAASAGISRKLAAFHLDKLVETGLLTFQFQRTGVGRPSKVYEPAETEIRVMIPARRHEVLAEILTQAVMTETEHGSAKAAAAAAARSRGFAAGQEMRESRRLGRLGAERGLSVTEEILSAYGYEPWRVGGSCIRLRNCPFHPLARESPELICQLNHAFVGGIVEGLQATKVDAVLAPAAGECCIELRG